MKLSKTVAMLSLAGIMAFSNPVVSQAKDFTRLATSDNGDGTFNNPVIYGDFPDMEVIRVNDTFYMVTTTMFVFPGATLLKSKDLVNWEYCANPLQRIRNSEEYNLENGKNRYSHGQWASSLRYNPDNETYYIMFLTLDEGGFLLSTKDPEGEWDFRQLARGYYDCGLMFDGGKTYVAYGIGDLYISELDENFNNIKEKKVFSVNETIDKASVEGSRLYHIGDYYYIYATYPGWPGHQTCFRAKDIWGPYEEKMILNDGTTVHQGALVETSTGEWWTMLFRDNGSVGRTPYLLPVKWVNGWPEVGTNGKAGEKYNKPDVGVESEITYLPTNDAFRDYQLGMQWGWNHNPDMSKWSLTQRPGFMRLRTASVTKNPYQARNTLTQRILGYHKDKSVSYGTVAIDISNMADGDVCGFGVMQDPLAFIGVKMAKGEKYLYYYSSSLTNKISKQEKLGNKITENVIYLRALPSLTTGKCKFAYSLDNKKFTSFGGELSMAFDLSFFTGNKFAIFNYATDKLGGYIDVDWFTTEPEFEENDFYGDDFTGYPDEALTVDHLEINLDPEVVLMTGSSSDLLVTAIYQDGHKIDVTSAASYESSDEKVIKAINGRLLGVSDGDATVTISYAGEKGEPVTTSLKFTTTSFPLISGMYNPNIWDNGTFDEETHVATVGQYGFGGWQYPSGLDISGYKYLVAQVDKKSVAGLSFRIFDVNNYWSDPAMSNFDKDGYSIVSLKDLKSNDGRKMDPSHIYIVGFWRDRKDPFTIEKVFLSNSDDPASVDGLEIQNPEKPVNVFTLTGICIKKNVPAVEATAGLPKGIYLIDNKKVMVK